MADMPNMKVQPYLFFDGRWEEALEFYKKAIGAEVTFMMRVDESPDKGGAHASGDKIMHAAFMVGNTLIMASDGFAKGNPKFEGFSLSITAKDEAESKNYSVRSAKAEKSRKPSSRPSSRRPSAW